MINLPSMVGQISNIAFILVFILFQWSCDGNRSPIDKQPRTAEEVSRAIERAIHKSDWDQTKWVSWIFPGNRRHLWDRERNFAEVRWDDYRALLDLDTQSGEIFQGGNQIPSGPVKDSLIQRAWAAHINDAFWLNAPSKLYDDGTVRSLVERDSQTLLKVEYTTGGVTPGDYYIWHFDENYLPTAWEMYVSVIPEKGVLSTWENWITLESGAKIATHHYQGDRLTEIREVKSGNSFRDFGRDEDPFKTLLNPD